MVPQNLPCYVGRDQTQKNVTKFLHEIPAAVQGHIIDNEKLHLKSIKQSNIQYKHDCFPNKIPTQKNQIVATLIDTSKDTKDDLAQQVHFHTNLVEDQNIFLSLLCYHYAATDFKSVWNIYIYIYI